MIIDTENLTVIRLTEHEVDTLREVLALLEGDSPKAPKILTEAQERLVRDLRYDI